MNILAIVYTALQKGMSIVSLIRFDTLEKILNFYYKPYTLLQY